MSPMENAPILKSGSKANTTSANRVGTYPGNTFVDKESVIQKNVVTRYATVCEVVVAETNKPVASTAPPNKNNPRYPLATAP